jgi:hypothetical protein
MEKKFKYITVKVLIESGQIRRFADIIQYTSKHSLSKPLGISYEAFERRLKNSKMLNMHEFFMLARLLEVEPCTLLKIFGPDKKRGKK